MDQLRLELDELLRRSRTKQLAVSWPLAVDQRLDALVNRAELAGENTNRRELLAAAMLATDLDGDALGDRLRAYRRARVKDALMDTPVSGNVVHLDRHKPGPRARSDTK
jgi:hypothetical protein